MSKRLRKGFLDDLNEIFDEARTMCAGTHPPDEIVDAMRRVDALREETLAIIRDHSSATVRDHSRETKR